MELNKFLPDTWIWKLVNETGSGVPPDVEKGDNKDEVVVPATVVPAYVCAVPFDAFGKKAQTNTERRFGIPLDTRNENEPEATELYWYWKISLYTIFLVGDKLKYLCSLIGDIVYAGAYKRTDVIGAETDVVIPENWVLTIDKATLSVSWVIVVAGGTRGAKPCPISILATITGFVPPPPRIVGVAVKARIPVPVITPDVDEV